MRQILAVVILVSFVTSIFSQDLGDTISVIYKSDQEIKISTFSHDWELVETQTYLDTDANLVAVSQDGSLVAYYSEEIEQIVLLAVNVQQSENLIVGFLDIQDATGLTFSEKSLYVDREHVREEYDLISLELVSSEEVLSRAKDLEVESENYILRITQNTVDMTIDIYDNESQFITSLKNVVRWIFFQDSIIWLDGDSRVLVSVEGSYITILENVEQLYTVYNQ